MNIAGPILHFGQTRRNATALVDGERTITYGELAEVVRRRASHLASCGVRHGDRVGLCLQDTADHVVALLAVAQLGGVVVSLDWRARPAENVGFIDGLGLACLLARRAGGEARG